MRYNLRCSLSQGIMKKTSRGASLRTSRSAHTVLLRMAADERRAERIRRLREAHSVKWRELAAYVGVSERSAHAWGATGAIAQENAAKVSQFFRERGEDIDADYIWRGEQPTTPNLMAVLNGDQTQTQLDRIEAQLARLQDSLDLVESYLEQQASEAVRRRVRQAADQRRSTRHATRPADPAAGDG